MPSKLTPHFKLLDSRADSFAVRSCETCRYVQAIQRHLATPVVCEQGFGLLANLTLRSLPANGNLTCSDCVFV